MGPYESLIHTYIKLLVLTQVKQHRTYKQLTIQSIIYSCFLNKTNKHIWMIKGRVCTSLSRIIDQQCETPAGGGKTRTNFLGNVAVTVLTYPSFTTSRNHFKKL